MSVATATRHLEALSAGNGSILSVENLKTGFGVHAVLHGVTFDVSPGEITAILGLNGAGKSVTLKTISGLIPAWSGKVSFKGNEITDLETEDRVARGMAHVLQGRAVFPHLSVEENLRLGGAVIRDKRAVAQSLERIYSIFPRLQERRYQLGGNLSGGEQEMLAVGRALMASPTLILVDEASQGLAPVAVQHLFETLKEVNRSGVTLLMVEQNVSFTLGIAERVLVMQKGEIVYEGKSASLDRDRLAALLGIGALLGKSVLGAEPTRKRRVASTRRSRPTASRAKPTVKTARKSVAKRARAGAVTASRAGATSKPSVIKASNKKKTASSGTKSARR